MTYYVISAVICLIIAFILLAIDGKRNGRIYDGEVWLPTRFRWLATLGDAFGFSAAYIMLKAFEMI